MESTINFNLKIPQGEDENKIPVVKVNLTQAVSLYKQLDTLLNTPLMDQCKAEEKEGNI